MQVKSVETYSSRSWNQGVAETMEPAIPATVGKRALWVVVLLCVSPGAGMLAQDPPSMRALTLTEARALARRAHPANRVRVRRP